VHHFLTIIFPKHIPKATTTAKTNSITKLSLNVCSSSKNAIQKVYFLKQKKEKN
jgi:hypothetical protein